MKIKNLFWAVVVFLISCQIRSHPLIPVAPATSTSTHFPIRTIEYPSFPNKFSVIGDREIKFNNWGVSFLLPKDWDVNNRFIGFDNGFQIESYFFYGPSLVSSNGTEHEPELAFLFHRLQDDVNVNAYLEDEKNWIDNSEFDFEKSLSPKDIGLNLESAKGYKCSDFKKGANDYTCYIIRIIYKNESIQIRIFSESTVFPKVEAEFLDIIRSISFNP